VIDFHFQQEKWLQEVGLPRRFFGMDSLQEKRTSAERFGINSYDLPGIAVFEAMQDNAFGFAEHGIKIKDYKLQINNDTAIRHCEHSTMS
jgi:hypothetical protein